jgi:hypothetical protein
MVECWWAYKSTVGVFISVGAISHCQECFFHLLWTFCFAVGVLTSVWAYLFLWGRFYIARNVFAICYGRFALPWVYLPLCGCIYFCGGDFPLPGTFCKLPSTSTSVTSFTSAWATYILTVNMI